MISPPAAEDVPCERCLSWRIEQSRYVASHINAVITAVLADLGHDPHDESVRAVVLQQLRLAGTDGP